MKRIIINDRYTYECDDDTVKVGDTAVLPCGQRKPGDNRPIKEGWRGTVTAVDSTYTGPAKKVMRIIHEAELLPDGTIS